jgi:hypothetical protein
MFVIIILNLCIETINMKFLKNRYGKNNINSNSNNSGGGTSAADPDLKTRRIIKGTIPPTATDTNTDTDANTMPSTSTDDIDHEDEDDERSQTHLLGTSAQKREIMKEKSETWRKERLDATNRLRKENKQQEIKEHRFNLRNKSDNKENLRDGLKKEDGIPPFDVPPAFSVENTFPEHKRKSRSVDHDTGKKLRSDEDVEGKAVDVDVDVDVEVEVEQSVGETWRSKAAHLIKASGPGVLVAVVAIVAVRFLRK